MILMTDAVYSDQYTGTRSDKASSPRGYIQKLPYFKLMRKVDDERDEKAEQLQEQLDVVKKRWVFAAVYLVLS